MPTKVVNPAVTRRAGPDQPTYVTRRRPCSPYAGVVQPARLPIVRLRREFRSGCIAHRVFVSTRGLAIAPSLCPPSKDDEKPCSQLGVGQIAPQESGRSDRRIRSGISDCAAGLFHPKSQSRKRCTDPPSSRATRRRVLASAPPAERAYGTQTALHGCT